MQTYWTLTRKQRFELTQEQLERYCALQAAEKGVELPSKTTGTTTKPTIPPTNLKTRKWYRVGSTLFQTETQARTFISLSPHNSDYDYYIGSDIRYATPVETMEVTVVELPDHSEVEQKREELRARRDIIVRAEAEDNRQKEIEKKFKDATQDIWEDYKLVLDEAHRYTTINRLSVEYLRLANNDPVVARNFLEKLYSAQDIDAAVAWFAVDDNAVAAKTDEV